jgi:sulfopyruvate decarboxylase subunit beta
VQQADRDIDRRNVLEGHLMIRSDVLKSIIEHITDELVICNIGMPSQELFMMDDQPSNFYMLGTMGLSSSIGLGLALAQPEKVIAIDGDGSVLTNLGTLPTIANNVADNFVLLIIDNGSYGSTGDQPTYAGQKTSLAAVAEACGCENVVECQAEDTATELQKALASNQMTIIVCKCESGNIPVTVIDINPVVIRDRFMKEVARRG